MKTDVELSSLIALYDDPDPVVRGAVIGRMLQRGEEILEPLMNLLYQSENSQKREFYTEIVNFLKQEIAMDDFSKYLTSPDPILIEGLFLASRVINYEIDRAGFEATVDEISEELRFELSDDKTAIENIEIFNYIFFRRLGFKHSDPMIEDEKYALINSVLVLKEGNPIAISLLYFMLCRKTGLPVYPLCFPGGFVPVYVDNYGKIIFYLNIFKSGAIFLEDNLKAFFGEIGMIYDRSKLNVRQDKALISIYCELLCYMYKTQSNDEKLKLSERMLEVIGEERYL